jgi:hypothetical protein
VVTTDEKRRERKTGVVSIILSIENLKLPLTYQSGRDWREVICAFHENGNHSSRGM